MIEHTIDSAIAPCSRVLCALCTSSTAGGRNARNSAPSPLTIETATQHGGESRMTVMETAATPQQRTALPIAKLQLAASRQPTEWPAPLDLEALAEREPESPRFLI